MLFGGLDKFVVHGFEHIAIFADEHLERVSALCDVALDDTEQTLVATRIYKDFQIHLVAQFLVVECHDAFYDNHIVGLHVDSLLTSRASDVRIGGLLDSFSTFELFDLVCQQWPVKRIGVVEVGELALIFGHIPLVLVVRVLWDDATASGGKLSTIFRTTVVLPDPVPPAIPMMSMGEECMFNGWSAAGLPSSCPKGFTQRHNPCSL